MRLRECGSQHRLVLGMWYCCVSFGLLVNASHALAQTASSAPAPDTRLQVHDYDAKADERGHWVALAWRVSARTNFAANGMFVIERSTDGLAWSKFGEQPFWVSPALPEEYHFTDRLDDGYRFYRLLARYDQGPTLLVRTTRLDLVKALIHLDHRIDTLGQALALSYIIDRPKQLLLRLYDRIGQQIYTQKIASDEPGPHQDRISLASLAPGKYLAELTQVEDDLKVAEIPFTWVAPPPARRTAAQRKPAPRKP